MQNCCTCGIEKDNSEFHRDKSTKTGLSPRCKLCKRDSDSKYRKANLEKIHANDKEYYLKNSDKIREKSKTWYEANKERSALSKKEWNEKNKDTIREYKKQYNADNKDWLKQYMNEYMKNRYRTNINYRLKSICNKRIRDCIRNKSQATMDIVGCDIEYLKSWIEYQFNGDMNWSNMGNLWHIDHVKPCASFDFSNDDSIVECYHWSNLRPLLAIDNIRKKDKYNLDIIAKHNKIVEKYIKSIGVPSA